MAKYSALDLAHWFINANQQSVFDNGDDPISLLKLLKLIYYADGCYLALHDEPMFEEPILAWEHGPVVREVYDRYMDSPYQLTLSEIDKVDLQKFNKKDSLLLQSVYSQFGQYSAWGLANMTHEEEPWIEATNNGKIYNKVISNSSIGTYFCKNYIDDEDRRLLY